MTDTAVPTYALRFPQQEADAVDQDEERVSLEIDGEQREIRFHDYEAIYGLPGLYEQLFYDVLECCSPQVVVDALAEHADDPGDLRVLDVGAGNGMVGERLRDLGVDTVVGVDIIEAAAAATARDRGGVYDDYLVADLTDLDDEQSAVLAGGDFNAMVTVAALGFGDIPCDAFAAAFNHVADGGLIGLTIKEDFLAEGDFAEFVRHLDEDGAMTVLSRRRYRHRLSVTGEELHYIVVIAEKQRDIVLR
jgi:predicted TPR repeat methyltransferase